MSEFDFNRYKAKNYYNIFNCEIALQSKANNAIFIHEFYHHLQNFTTIQGAERMSYFIQILAHTSLLAKTTDTLYIPFDKWMENDELSTNESTIKELNQIYLHIGLWGYLEQVKALFELPPTYKDRHGELGLVDVDYFNEGEKIPMPIMILKDRKSDKILGQPIGGFYVAESGAFSLEQLHSTNPFPINQLLNGVVGYEYHAIPYLISQKLTTPRKVYLASFLLCDLAMVISTPLSGIQIMYRYWESSLNESMTESDILALYKRIYTENKDIMEDAIKLEKDSLFETRQILDTLRTEESGLVEVLIHQIDLLVKGLNYRIENPYFIIESLLQEVSPETTAELLKIFPVNKLAMTGQDVDFFSQQSVDNYQILNMLLDMYLSLKEFPYSIRMIPDDLDDDIPYTPNKFQFNWKNLDKDNLQFSIFPHKDENEETNLEGYILQHLGLTGKKIVYIP